MIQKIQAFEVPNRGTATQAKVEVQERFTTGDKAVIYYDLRNPNETTSAYDLRIQDYVTLPYTILSRTKIVVTGDDRAAAISDVKLASNIVFRERTDITAIRGIKLALTNRDPNDACMMYQEDNVQTLYLDTEDLTSATALSETEDMRALIEGAYYVSDGTSIRYWNGKGFDSKFSQLCK
jgi:hypothetical protein